VAGRLPVGAGQLEAAVGQDRAQAIRMVGDQAVDARTDARA
jgi:hypothetical protein